jgi:homoserine dehydrogenase
VLTRYQITLTVLDRPGVLAAIATVFSQHGVSVENVEQSVRSLAPGDSVATATLVIVTHKALESDLAATVTAVAANDVVSSVTSVLRVEGM